MSKFIECRFRRIESAIISELEILSNNLDTVKRFYECNAISAKVAYKRANIILSRFGVLVNRLSIALSAANRSRANGYNFIYIENPKYRAICSKFWIVAGYFGF